MTIKKVSEIAQRRAQLSEATSQEDSLKEQEIVNILSISKKVIVEFYKYACEEDRKWMKERTDALIAEKGNRKYFAPFRAEFAHKFFPELCKKKEVKKAKSILEEFEEIDNAS